MAKRKARRGVRKAKPAGKSASARRSGKRPARSAKRPSRRATPARKKVARKAVRRTSAPSPKAAAAPRKAARLERARRTIDDVVPSPPSSLNMNRRGSAVRTGRAEVAERLLEHAGMSTAITAGDVDVDVENAYFSGDETPGGDNPTPDQDVVDDIGKALGVEYQDNEELRASDKVIERDKHRWELDPASSEDYKSRK
jgi:hypothetical protein